MATIFLKNVGVDIPIFDVKQASLKKALLGRTIGGRFAQSGAAMVWKGKAASNLALVARKASLVLQLAWRSARIGEHVT